MQNTNSIPPLRLEIQEAAAALRISRAYLYAKIKAGSITAVKDGGRTFINVDELRRYAEAAPRLRPAA